MIYKFRGFNLKSKTWIRGNGVEALNNAAQIHDNVANVWVLVDPETVGRAIRLSDSTRTEVYQGDIVRYSFKHKGETYHKYFKICENEYDTWAEELWRDHELDCETFEVSRFHNVKYAGTRKDITSFNTRTAWTVVGNIWQNPELL